MEEGGGVVTALILPVTAGSAVAADTRQPEQRRLRKMGYY